MQKPGRWQELGKLAVLFLLVVLAFLSLDSAFFCHRWFQGFLFNALILELPPQVTCGRALWSAAFSLSSLAAAGLFSMRRQSREALWEGERLLTSIFDSIQEGLIIKDPEFNIIRVNAVVERWFAHALPLEGKKCYQAFKGLDAPCEGCPSREALKTGHAAHAVVPKVGPGGQQVGWLDLYAFPLVDPVTGARSGVIEFLRDITERVEAEEALRQSEERYRLLVNNIPAVVFKGYLDWTLDLVDDKIQELTGYTKEDFNSRRMKWTEVMLPEDLESAQQVFRQALKTNRQYVREYRIRHRDGRALWIQARGQIICDPQGKAEYISGVFFDITAHKQVEQEVERLASFPELNPDPVLEVDPCGNLTYFNLAATKALEKLGASEGEKLFLPADIEEILRTAKETEERYFYREVLIKDAVFGEKIEFIPRYEVARIRASDITARRRTEEALKRSEASLAEAQRIVHLGNWEWNITTDELFWSDEIYRIFGLSPRQFGATYQAFLDAVHPEDRPRVQEAVNRALYQGQPYYIGHRIVWPDGQERFVFERGEVTFDPGGRPLRLVGTVQDITEARRAQEALQESERRYRLLAENVTDVIWTMDLELRFTYISPSVRLFTGYTPEEVLELTLEDLLTPASLEAVRDRLAEELALGRQEPVEGPARSTTLELECLVKGGGTGWAEVKATFLRDEAGTLVSLLGVTRDITGRKRLEEELRQAQKMEVVGRLAGGVAHDFNNLLTAILGYCELLMVGMPEDAPDRLDVLEIKKAGERAALLTRQLLAFSRRQVLQPKRLNLNTVIDNLGKMLERVIGEDIQLTLLPGPDLGWVMADPGQVEQVILNLAVNARDAMPQGGRLAIQTGNVELDEAYAQGHTEVAPGPYVLLTVSDTGFGMDARTRGNIFEPFFTTKEVGKGTGLGLSMVYGIVKQSGGHIWVYSEPGQGTTFKVYLPRVDAAPPVAAVDRQAEVPPPGRETILLVEDEEVVRQVAHRILAKQGYRVLAARDGQEALEVLERHPGPVHLVLTDLVMPGMNGRELAHRLVARRPQIKVLFMSGYAENGIVNQGVLQQGISYLPKPFAARVLARRVRELLDGPAPRRQ